MCKILKLSMLLLMLMMGPSAFAAKPVTVGVFQFPPLSYTNERGEHSGLFIDIIREVSQREDWDLRFVPGTWSDGFEKMKNGQLDLMPCVQQRPEREVFLDYPKEAAFVVWGQVLVRSNSKIESLFDLADKKIGLMKEDANGKNFLSLMNNFHISVSVSNYAGFTDVAQAIAKGEVDAGVFTNTSGHAFLDANNLKATDVVFSPADLKFATAKGSNGELLATLDRYLSEWKKDRHSPYYTLQNKYFSTAPQEKEYFWKYGAPFLLSCIAIVMVAIIWRSALRRQVRKQTDQLREELELRTRVEAELQETTQSLRDSMSRYRAFFDHGPDGVVVLDPDTARIVEFNDRVCQQLGYSREEFALLSAPEIEALETAEQSREHIQKIMREGYGSFDTQQRTKMGEVRDVHVEAEVIKLSGRDIYHCVWRDITESKRAAAELRESRARYQSFFQIAPAGIIVWDTQGRVLEWNKKAEEIFGYTAEEAYGRTFWDLIIPESAHELVKKVSTELFAGQEMLGVRNENVKKDSRTITCEWHNIPLRDSAGNVVGAISMVMDITGQLADAAERKRLNEQLSQAQKMEAIGTLAGGIAHDFNNILGAIMGYTELSVGMLPQGDPVRENLQEVLVASVRAKELVQQILAFGRRGEKKVVPVESGLLVSEAMKLLRSVIPKTISIERDIDLAAGYVLADPTELHQVVMNLCTNAYQAMPGEKGVLRVRLSAMSIDKLKASSIPGLVPGDYVRLDVVDDGVGMNEETLSRIFEPYFTTKAVGKGTGLGLAMVHGIVKSLGGAIEVRSAPGIGTSFAVYLPKAEPAKAEAAESKDIASLLGMGSVLVVDDEPALARLTAKMLESLGYKTRVVTDPLEALRVFESDPAGFDAIVTDQTMPGMTGADLVRRVKAVRSGIAAVMCTGYSDLIDEIGAKEIGIAVYVQKPYDRNRLGAALATALDQHS